MTVGDWCNMGLLVAIGLGLFLIRKKGIEGRARVEQAAFAAGGEAALKAHLSNAATAHGGSVTLQLGHDLSSGTGGVLTGDTRHREQFQRADLHSAGASGQLPRGVDQPAVADRYDLDVLRRGDAPSALSDDCTCGAAGLPGVTAHYAHCRLAARRAQ